MPGGEDLSKVRDLELVEGAFNELDRGDLQEYLDLLGEGLSPNEALYKSLQGSDLFTEEFDAAIQHAGRDWFANGDGYIKDNKTFWQGYESPELVEEYVRDALTEAIRRSIDAENTESRQHWPIDMWMQCGYTKFKVLVTWRKLGDGERDGLVTVIFLVPDTALRITRGSNYQGNKSSGARDFGDDLYPLSKP
jgi:hypothetical protein